MEMTINVMDVIEIVLLVASCYACYIKGKVEGINDTIYELIDREIISLSDLDKLEP
jgi:hypothetical protein